MSAGKGDTPRPKSVDVEEFARRWDRAFGQAPPTSQCPYCGCLSSRSTGWGRECLRCDRKFSRR